MMRQQRYQQEDATTMSPHLSSVARPMQPASGLAVQADADTLLLDDFFLEVAEDHQVASSPSVRPPPMVSSPVSNNRRFRPPEEVSRWSDRKSPTPQQSANVETPQVALHAAVNQQQQPQQEEPAFEGEGFKEVGSARRAADEHDDEFDYAFEGGQREGITHKKVFKPKAMPAHLVTNVKQKLLHALEEEEEEEEPEDEGQEQDVENEEEDAVGVVEHSEDEAEVRVNKRMAEDMWKKAGTNQPADIPTGPSECSLQRHMQHVSQALPPSSSAFSPSPVPQPSQPSSIPSVQSNPLASPSPHTPAAPGFQAGEASRGVAGAVASPRVGDPAASVSEGPGAATGRDVAVPASGGGLSVEDEWDEANQRVHEEEGEESIPGPTPHRPHTLSYHEILLHLWTLELTEQRRQVEAQLPPPPGFFHQFLCLAAPPLKPLLKEQMVRLLSLARLNFSESDPVHFQLLCSVFCSLTGSRKELSRLGSHWTEVGFQGQDPATDLRSCGLLGLLHMYLLYQHDPVNASRLYRLSRSSRQEFPVAVVSLNITKWTIQMLREGRLSGAATRMGSMVEASGKFYIGTFYTFYDIWRTGSKTMSESGYVMHDLEVYCKKKPDLMIDKALDVLEP